MTQADPSVFLVPSRLLRKVIVRDRTNGFTTRRAPRLSSYAISGKALAAIVDSADLSRPVASWPSTVILLERPDGDELAGSAPDVLLLTWRRLFRARTRAVVAGKLASGTIHVADRIAQIGRTEFEEIRLVLRQDGLVAADESDATAYAEFASLYLESTYFAPGLLPHAFPAIEDYHAVEVLLADDADGPTLLAKARPPGAPEPADSAEAPTPEPDVDDTAEYDIIAKPKRNVIGRLALDADREAGRGNDVRAAIHWARSARISGVPEGQDAITKGVESLQRLAHRLQEALFLRADEAAEWAGSLRPLLRRAAKGYWTNEAKLLYDLQAVCLDHEREIYRLDLIGWAISFGRKPLKNPLPHLREVTMSKHLRGAGRRLAKVKLSKLDRLRLETLIRPAVHRAEEALRERFRPWINSTLEAKWVTPRNLPERVAHAKLVEELLDQIVRNGYLSLGDLRDAASRGQLKLPDLTSPAEFFQGGPLLDTDRALAKTLDGVHRRGEIYLRWLQRMSALTSGTKKGRWFSLYVALPFGGSFIVIKGIEHLVSAGRDLAGWMSGAAAKVPKPGEGHSAELDVTTIVMVLVLGSIALGVINFSQFRQPFFEFLKFVGRAFRMVLLDLPAFVLNNPLLKRILGSKLAEAFWRLVVKPGVAALVLAVLASKLGGGARSILAAGSVGFVGASFLLNTRVGRSFEEAAIEGLVRAWRSFAYNLVPGAFRLIIETFERIVERIERHFYAVDEWLRFREGKSQASLVTKAVLGLFWFGVAYLARIYVNLLIEPQINPIKHFPVVTVSHKIILPLSVQLTKHLMVYLSPYLGEWFSGIFVGLNVLLLPGVFGFLVWELKENWRLYEANRRPTLGPAIVGSHGETVPRLLRPGFHSGTLPKLYAKLRHYEPLARQGHSEKAALKKREGLHHVEEAVRRFIERDFIELLHESRAMGPIRITVGSIRLATNRIRFELVPTAETHEVPSLWLDLEERQGLLAAGIHQAGWLEQLDEDARQTFDEALDGFFKMSGVSLVHTPGDLVGGADFVDAEIAWKAWVDAWETEAGDEREERPVTSARGATGNG